MNFKRFNLYSPLVILSALLTLGVIACKNLLKENDWIRYNSKGKVKSYKIINYEATIRFGKVEKGNRALGEPLDGQNQECIFDNNGKIKEINYFNIIGNLESKKIYNYDEMGRNYETNVFNQEGKLIEKYTTSYNKEGKIDLENTYDSSGIRWSTVTSEYNDRGLLKETKGFYGNNDYVFINFKYDNNNLLNEEIWNAKYSWSDTLYHDVVKHKYNEKGKKIESIYTISGTRFTYNYDEKGNVIEDYWFNDGVNIEKSRNYKYEYDKKGNWIKRIEYINNKPFLITERVIEYYN